MGIYPCAASGEAGTYDLGAAGDFAVWIETAGLRRFWNADSGSSYFGKLAAVSDWGDTAWTSMNSMFKYASKFDRIPADAPNLAGVTDMGRMFFIATAFNQDLTGWNGKLGLTSSCTDFKTESALSAANTPTFPSCTP